MVTVTHCLHSVKYPALVTKALPFTGNTQQTRRFSRSIFRQTPSLALVAWTRSLLLSLPLHNNRPSKKQLLVNSKRSTPLNFFLTCSLFLLFGDWWLLCSAIMQQRVPHLTQEVPTAVVLELRGGLTAATSTGPQRLHTMNPQGTRLERSGGTGKVFCKHTGCLSRPGL